MKHFIFAVVIFLVSAFLAAGLLKLADIPAVITGGVVAGAYLFAIGRRRGAPTPVAPPPTQQG